MPREKISNHDGEDTRAEVGWERDGDAVQIAVTDDNASGLRCWLSAPALDRLIRTLQKARRQAFGPPPATAAVIEILEPGRATGDTPGESVIVPREIRVNGTPLATAGGGVRVHEIKLPAGKELATVTLTLVARRITIAAEGDL